MGCVSLRLFVVVATGFCVLGNGSAISAEWDLNKTLTFGLLHTDSHVDDQPDDQGSITTGQVVPSLSLLRRGPYSDLLLLSEFEYLKSDEEGVESLRPRIFSSFKSTIREDRLFLDADVELRQDFDDAGDAATELLSQRSDVSTRYNLNIDPRIVFGLGQYSDLQISYGFNAFGTTDSEVADSLTNGANFSVEHDRSDRGFKLGTSIDINRSDISDSEPLIQRSVVSSVTLDVGHASKVSGSVGREWNQIPVFVDSVSNATEADIERGTIWDVGLHWNPSARTSLFAGYGQRFFGGRPLVEIKHRMRRSNVSLGWTRSLTRSRATLTGFEFTNVSDLQEQVSLDTLPEDSVIGPDPEVVVNEYAIEEQFRASYDIRGRVSSLRFETVYARQELRFRKSTSNESRISLRTSFTRELGNITALTLSYQRTEGRSASRYHENQVRVALTFDLR